MIITKPEDMNRAFAADYNFGKIQSFFDFYKPEALLVPQPASYWIRANSECI